MELQQHISHQRIRHIIDSYLLTGDEAIAFNRYLSSLLHQYPHGLLELALVETLIKSWLTIPMVKGVPFLSTTHQKLKQWQQDTWPQDTYPLSLTPAQFSQITGLDAQPAFADLISFASQSTQATAT
ncbi:MAG: hypothetical protein AAFQ63_03950 [Cyanobacteria bacterium J06621_11]